MERFKFNKAIINVHGEVDCEKLEQATIRFLKKAYTNKQTIKGER